MNATTLPLEACPRCGLATHIIQKLLMIGPASSDPKARQAPLRMGCCEQMSVDDLKPEYADGGQFIQALYCEGCAIGFVPEYMAKPSAPKYQHVEGGWRRLLPDGAPGTLLLRIADDPDRKRE
jgi:hypothetical protein